MITIACVGVNDTGGDTSGNYTHSVWRAVLTKIDESNSSVEEWQSVTMSASHIEECHSWNHLPENLRFSSTPKVETDLPKSLDRIPKFSTENRNSRQYGKILVRIPPQRQSVANVYWTPIVTSSKVICHGPLLVERIAFSEIHSCACQVTQVDHIIPRTIK